MRRPKPRIAGAYIVKSIDGRAMLPHEIADLGTRDISGYVPPTPTDKDRRLAAALLRARKSLSEGSIKEDDRG